MHNRPSGIIPCIAMITPELPTFHIQSMQPSMKRPVHRRGVGPPIATAVAVEKIGPLIDRRRSIAVAIVHQINDPVAVLVKLSGVSP